MKRVFTFLMAAAMLLGASQPLAAQERGEWSIKGGIGWFSLPDFVGLLVAGLGSIDVNKEVESNQFMPMLNPNVEVQYGINDWLALGGSLALGYAGVKTELVETGATSKISRAFYPTLCISAQTRYFSAGKFTMYGSWGAGVMLLFSTQKSAETTNNQVGVAPMANLYPLCFSYGDKIGCFCEVGWGAKGFSNVGIYYNF